MPAYAIRAPLGAPELRNIFACTGRSSDVLPLVQLLELMWTQPVHVCTVRLCASDNVLIEIRTVRAVTQRRVAEVLSMLAGHADLLRTLRAGPAIVLKLPLTRGTSGM